MSISPAPLRERFLNTLGQITEPWRKWLNEISGGSIPYHKFKSVIYTATKTLTVSDFGRVIRFNNGTNNVGCFLPSVGEMDIDTWVIIMRVGTGSLTIQAADSDTIEKSGPGGKLVCDEADRVCANVWLYLATETEWAIMGGTGIWKAF